MRFVTVPVLLSLLALTACNTSGSLPAAESTEMSTPSDGVVPGQLPE